MTAASGSSSTSSLTSASSSTSDDTGPQGERKPLPAARDSRLTSIGAGIRLTHPFPSVLDGVATSAIALLAGADAARATRLGVAMVCLQAAIGAANDVVDRQRDAGRKPGKPIPAGLLSVESARVVAATAAVLGLALSAASGLPTAALGSAILAIGLAYDLRLRGTAWSWLPFAVGIPLLPVYAWVGTGAPLPGVFAVLVPTAFLAGAALAVANALADVERDRDSGASSIAARLGPRRAWAAHALLHGVVVAIALPTLATGRPTPVAIAVAVAGTICVVAGVALARDASASRRERGWELEAVGVAGLAAGWLAGVVPLAK